MVFLTIGIITTFATCNIKFTDTGKTYVYYIRTVYWCALIQKIIAFENGFELLMDIIQTEDYSEGGVCIVLHYVLTFVRMYHRLYIPTDTRLEMTIGLYLLSTS